VPPTTTTTHIITNITPRPRHFGWRKTTGENSDKKAIKIMKNRISRLAQKSNKSVIKKCLMPTRTPRAMCVNLWQL